MKPSLPIAILIVLSFGSLFAAQSSDPYAHGSCPGDKEAVIDAEAHCSNSGINIHFDGDDGAKVACMQDKEVQRLCGQNGGVTRQQAFKEWYHKLQTFQANCAVDGGVFSFKDSAFKEPQDESFCLESQPEVTTNMFEDSLCNYRSMCPAVAVLCTYCGAIAPLPDNTTP